MLPCSHHNGVLIGYLLTVVEVHQDRSIKEKEVSARYLQKLISDRVTGLKPATEYSVSVSAINSAGTGKSSERVIFQTKGGI